MRQRAQRKMWALFLLTSLVDERHKKIETTFDKTIVKTLHILPYKWTSIKRIVYTTETMQPLAFT